MLAVLLCAGASSPAAAQDVGDETTFSDATGAMWGFTSFEVWFVLAGGALAANDGCGGGSDDLGCVGLTALARVTAGVTTGLATHDQDAPANAPFILHHSVWGGLTAMMLGIGLAGGDDDTRGFLGVLGTLAGMVGMGAYTWTQSDYLLHDPGATAGVHVMTWGVPAAALLGLLVGAAIDDDEPDVMALVAGLAAAITYGIGIGITEGGRPDTEIVSPEVLP